MNGDPGEADLAFAAGHIGKALKLMWQEAGVAPILDGIGMAAGVAALRGAGNAARTQHTKSNLQMGRRMHNAYRAGETGKEFRLPSGRRIDFLDVKNGTIRELKPNNPRGIQQGQRQLQIYKQELETMPRFQGIQWRTYLDLY